MNATAPPSPPSGGGARRVVNGAGQMNGHGGGAPRLGGWASSGDSGTGAGQTNAYPHINDLIEKANSNLDVHAPMRTMLQQADQSARQAEANLDFGRLDLAYIEYLIATDLVANQVPRHKDYPELHTGRGRMWQLHLDLQKRLKIRHEVFREAGETIRKDNARSGARPRMGAARSRLQPRLVSNSPASRPSSIPPYENESTLDMPDGPVQDRLANSRSTTPTPNNQNQLRLAELESPSKRKPPIQPKPDSLQRRSYGLNPKSGSSTADSSQPDDLADRFARLRSPAHKDTPASPSFDGSLQSRNIARVSSPTPQPSWNDVPRPSSALGSFKTQAAPLRSPQGNTFAPTVPQPHNRPAGPRDLPPSLTIPSRPPKIPLNTQLVSSMPKPPSPTYSPARTYSSHGSMEFPASGSIISSARIVSTTSSHNSNNITQANFDPGAHNSHGYTDNLKHSRDLPNQSVISANDLYRYIKQGSDKLSLLIIDVRNRRKFDEGHIFAQSVICVEPLALRPGMSAEDIEERLVLSSEQEQALFNERNKFDLVVFYDQSSASVRASGYGRPSLDKLPLSSLEQALGDFSYGKPLRQAPVLLSGGLDAWVDLVGAHALKTTSNTNLELQTLGSSPPRLGRPLARVTKARSSQRLQAMKGFLDSSKDGEENKNGPDRSRNQSERRSQSRRLSQEITPSSGADSDLVSIAGADGSRSVSYSRDYQDFLHRFPEVSDIKESMTSPVSPRGRSSSTVLDDKFHGFTRMHQSPSSDTAGSPGSISRPPVAVPRPAYKGHSEKSYYPPIPDRPPPIVPPQAAPSESLSSYNDIKVGQTGLQNFGATCYMNAVVQCLSGTMPLTRFFMDGSFRNSIQRDNALGSRGRLPEIYASVMKHMWDGNSTFIVPKTLRDFVANDNREFYDPCTQHDANDFLVYILDRLHEDLNCNFNRTRLKSLTTEDEHKRESMPPQIVSRIEFNRYSHRNMSWISRLFDGQHSSRLQCPACGCRSTSYETFKAVSLEIPQHASTVYQCLDAYTTRETLTGDDRWLCPDCKVPREATKKITFTRAPRVLVIQLKRFQTVRRGLTNKNTTRVRFPLLQLDLTPYMMPELRPESRPEALAKYGGAVLEPELETTAPFRYDAYAVVQHAGSLSTGHYTALVRTDMQRETWMEFNDKHVQSIKADKVVTEKAYLLFYVRSDTQ
ncbi:MAG: ubiquitin-specific protease doa4 [Sclerophora amabilis]|nr:MAG: ubiquitin-specific protease doa4 [Sclerophora amabilis]